MKNEVDDLFSKSWTQKLMKKNLRIVSTKVKNFSKKSFENGKKGSMWKAIFLTKMKLLINLKYLFSWLSSRKCLMLLYLSSL